MSFKVISIRIFNEETQDAFQKLLDEDYYSQSDNPLVKSKAFENVLNEYHTEGYEFIQITAEHVIFKKTE